MTEAFREMQGGLFTKVQKADVGDALAKLREAGAAMLCWADPFASDASTPEHIKQATVECIESGAAGHYTAPIGNTELKIALAGKLSQYNRLNVDPQRNIIVTPGSDSGLFLAMLPFIAPGDEIMIVDPSYPNNYQNTRIMGGVAIPIPVHADNGYQFDIEDFEKRLTPKTKMVVLTNPNNPTTTVYRREKLEQLSKFIIDNDLIAVVDQAFEDAVYDDIEMVTLASLPGMWERTVTVFSFSKGMGLSGYRVGYIVADDVIMDKYYAAAVSVVGATNTAAQIGALAGLKNTDFLAEYNARHCRRRNLAYEILGHIPGVYMMKPESGYLSWLDVSKLGSSDEICTYLSEEAKVAVNAGEPYGRQGEGHLRIVHGAIADETEFKDALIRIRNALYKRAAQLGLCSNPPTFI